MSVVTSLGVNHDICRFINYYHRTRATLNFAVSGIEMSSKLTPTAAADVWRWLIYPKIEDSESPDVGIPSCFRKVVLAILEECFSPSFHSDANTGSHRIFDPDLGLLSAIIMKIEITIPFLVSVVLRYRDTNKCDGMQHQLRRRSQLTNNTRRLGITVVEAENWIGKWW